MSNWPNDVDTTDWKDRKREAEKKKRRGRDAHEKKPHELWRLSGRLICRRCGRSARGLLPIRILKASPCHNSSAGRIAEAAGIPRWPGTAQDLSLYTEAALISRGGERIETNAPQGQLPVHAAGGDRGQALTNAPTTDAIAAGEAAYSRVEMGMDNTAIHATPERHQHLESISGAEAGQNIHVRRRLNKKTKINDGPYADVPAEKPTRSRDDEASQPTRMVRRRVTGKRPPAPSPSGAGPRQGPDATQGATGAEDGHPTEAMRNSFDEAENHG